MLPPSGRRVTLTGILFGNGLPPEVGDRRRMVIITICYLISTYHGSQLRFDRERRRSRLCS